MLQWIQTPKTFGLTQRCKSSWLSVLQKGKAIKPETVKRNGKEQEQDQSSLAHVTFAHVTFAHVHSDPRVPD